MKNWNYNRLWHGQRLKLIREASQFVKSHERVREISRIVEKKAVTD